MFAAQRAGPRRTAVERLAAQHQLHGTKTPSGNHHLFFTFDVGFQRERLLLEAPRLIGQALAAAQGARGQQVR